MYEQNNYEYLLSVYRSIWKNRYLTADDHNDEFILKEAISRELKDESSHPRVRKSPGEKFVSATKRILNSTLSAEEKILLINLHLEMLDQI